MENKHAKAPKRVHVFQHAPFESLGYIENWLSAQAAQIQYTRFYESYEFPNLQDVDLLVVMGGPMSVNDEEQYPWLRQEKAYLKQAIEFGLPILGICLGAQLIASALGARVFPNTHKEIGWFPVNPVKNHGDVFRFDRPISVFHWHGETFELPAGAVLLAQSEACKNQAFQMGKNIIGLQFHLETTMETADLLIQNCREELTHDPYIQTESAMRAVPESDYDRIHNCMSGLLSYLTH